MIRHTRLIFCLPFCLLLTGTGNLFAQDQDLEDSIRVEELLVMDTIQLDIPGPSNDISFYQNGLVFLSNTKYHQEMPPDHLTFGQVTSYFVPLEYVSLESSRPLFPNDPFPYAPAGTSYARDYKKVYFTKVMEIPGKRRVEKIFEMEIINEEASVYNQLPFTAGPTRFLHPAISADGEILVFSSDQTPSSGALDLYVVRKTNTGWTIPVNLGEEINTSGHERFPFLDQHNNLFFSSSGHMGYGGYDIYVSFFNGTGWDKPQNLTNLVNSDRDELGFSIHPGRKLAIFSTTIEIEEDPIEAVYKLGLNNSAFVLAGIESRNQDLSLLLKDMIHTGYTSATFGAASELEVEAGFTLTSLPLLTEPEEEPEVAPDEPDTEPDIPESEPLVEEPPVDEEQPEPVLEVPEPEPEELAIVVPVVTEPEPEPEPEPEIIEPEPEPEIIEPGPEPEPVVIETEPEPVVPEQEPVVFRVQIISAARPNTRPTVTIAGATHQTWEYHYKGAYRITVGSFDTVQEALSFRSRCRDAGYEQAFVAAFRGAERETDPTVFKR